MLWPFRKDWAPPWASVMVTSLHMPNWELRDAQSTSYYITFTSPTHFFVEIWILFFRYVAGDKRHDSIPSKYDELICTRIPVSPHHHPSNSEVVDMSMYSRFPTPPTVSTPLIHGPGIVGSGLCPCWIMMEWSEPNLQPTILGLYIKLIRRPLAQRTMCHTSRLGNYVQSTPLYILWKKQAIIHQLQIVIFRLT